MNYFEQLIDEYYFDFKDFWYPIYRKQILDAKFNDNKEALLEIKNNILKNWNLKEYKDLIIKDLGLNYLKGRNRSESRYF